MSLALEELCIQLVYTSNLLTRFVWSDFNVDEPVSGNVW